MEKLKGYRMPIFDEDTRETREEMTEKQDSKFKSFYLAVLSCNTQAYPSM